jgi:hypothetical protein
MICFLIEYFDYRTNSNYLCPVYACNEYDAWNFLLSENDPNGYELGKGEYMSKNILITNIMEGE